MSMEKNPAHLRLVEGEHDDSRAFGVLFRQGRDIQGHELVEHIRDDQRHTHKDLRHC